MSPADELRRLLTKRDRVAAELAALDRRIADAGARYCDQNRILVRLRPEQIRRELERLPC